MHNKILKTSNSYNPSNLTGGLIKQIKEIENSPEFKREFKKQLKKEKAETMKILEKIKNSRNDSPIKLNPQKATIKDIIEHAFKRQRLSESTIEKHLRYMVFMENHVKPIDFQNLNFNDFIEHMDYREFKEKASANALIHEWKAIQMFLKAYNIPFGDGSTWRYKPPTVPRPKNRILPLPDEVNKFFHYEYSKDKYENALYQYIFFHSFMIGWRVPSEIIEMKISDVKIDDPIPRITITETKKREQKRDVLNLEKSILTSSIHKSFKNWIDNWRPKVENQYSGDSLYLQPNGKPFTIRHLGHKLSEHGKKIYPEFRPYDMRHWCAVARLIQTKVKTKNFDVFAIQKWLGHENRNTTDNYINQALEYHKKLPVDWISFALKPNMGGQRRQIKTDRTQFFGLLDKITPVSFNGPEEI